MKFDYTNGDYAKYMVSVYRWNGEDFYYFHSFKEAREYFDRMKDKQEAGTTISLWDIKNDIRKDYVRL